jgi:hypothetical protein
MQRFKEIKCPLKNAEMKTLLFFGFLVILSTVAGTVWFTIFFVFVGLPPSKI